MPANFSQLRSDLDDLAGLDLEPTERDRLLNEGYRQLIAESEWLRVSAEIGPGVAGQAAYDLPDNYYRGLQLSVAGLPFQPATEDIVQEIGSGLTLQLAVRGVFYSTFDSNGVEQLSIYPVPAEGDTLTLRYVGLPHELENEDDEPIIPTEERGIVDYAAYVAFGMDEDNRELALSYKDDYDRHVATLKRLRRSRMGRGPKGIRIAGVNA